MPMTEAKHHAKLQRTQELCESLTDEQVIEYAEAYGHVNAYGQFDLDAAREDASEDHEYWDEQARDAKAERKAEGHV